MTWIILFLKEKCVSSYDNNTQKQLLLLLNEQFKFKMYGFK